MKKKVVVTGAAGFVGHSLVPLLLKNGFQVTAIDKSAHNLLLLKKHNPRVQVVGANIALDDNWQHAFRGADVVIELQARISSLDKRLFKQDNVVTTQRVVREAKKRGVKYLVHVSSSVVKSVADDEYVRTKAEAEKIVKKSGLSYAILRPTLMYGEHDYKHLGWISRFMQKHAFFPIPGKGKFIRQPLYLGDFCSIILACCKKRYKNIEYDVTGAEKISYVDLMREIAKAKSLKRTFVKVPVPVFAAAMQAWALATRKPMFTKDQLKALVAGDVFRVDPWWKKFGVKPTRLHAGLRKVFGKRDSYVLNELDD